MGIKTQALVILISAIEDNVGPNGSLNYDKVVRALLQLRNTPDRDFGLSDIEVILVVD